MDSILTLTTISDWQAKSDDELADRISEMNKASASTFNFTIPNDVRKAYANLITSRDLNGEEKNSLRCAFLESIRLLARDESGLEVLLTSDVIDLVLQSSQLALVAPACVKFNELAEAQKVLVNTFFNSATARRAFLDKKGEDALALRLSSIDEDAKQLRHLDLRIAFIVSAKERRLQEYWRGQESFVRSLCAIAREDPSETNMDEALKTAFNLFCHTHFDVEEKVNIMVNEVCLHHILRQGASHTVVQSCVNLIATMPVLVDLLCPKKGETESMDFFLEGRDMRFPQKIMDDLEKKLEDTERASIDILGTYFTVLINLCVGCKEARRYCRLQIIPPLTSEDVQRPPEAGATLRNRVIRVMQSTSHTRELAAQFLFVLCKRSVNRLIKYTGLGHAAGLLANSGLLGRINDPRKESDSEDSETEDYKSVENEVNPVTGCIRPERGPNPLDSMTEEQKEYEAMKLVDAMNEMLKLGLVKPASIGEDGRPREVQHLLQLTKDIPEPVDSSDED